MDFSDIRTRNDLAENIHAPNDDLKRIQRRLAEALWKSQVKIWKENKGYASAGRSHIPHYHKYDMQHNGYALSEFLDSLEGFGNSIATRNQRLKGIRAFYSAHEGLFKHIRTS